MSKPATKQQVAQVAAQIPAINVFDESLPRSIVAKVTGNVDGALTLGKGKYVGKMVQNEITPDATTTAWLTSDLVTTDLGFDTDNDCYIIAYNGTTLATDALVNCVVLGMAPNGKPVLKVDSPGIPPFVTMLVQLAVDNDVALGGTGTGAIAHPFTYTAKNAATGAVLKNTDGTDATGLSPRFARQQFAVTTAATNGHACRDENGVWILDDCDEVYERCA